MEKTSVVAMLVAAAAVASNLPSFAQQGNPAGATPSSMAPASAPAPNPQDRLFVLLAGQGGLAEVELAKLAESKGQSPAVKRFARRMLEDQARPIRNSRRRRGKADSSRPPSPRRNTRRCAASSPRWSGAAFDHAYMRGQVVEHQKTAQLLQWEMGNGQQAPLQRFAAGALPTVLDHLGHVNQLLAELTGAPARAGDGPTTNAPQRP